MTMKERTKTTQQMVDQLMVMPYQFDEDLNRKLFSMARQENCSPNEIAARLLNFALQEQNKIQYQHAQWRRLSPREREITLYICQGLTNIEIAQKLYISNETVKSHVHNILRKFSIRNKRELQVTLADCDISIHASLIN